MVCDVKVLVLLSCFCCEERQNRSHTSQQKRGRQKHESIYEKVTSKEKCIFTIFFQEKLSLLSFFFLILGTIYYCISHWAIILHPTLIRINIWLVFNLKRVILIENIPIISLDTDNFTIMLNKMLILFSRTLWNLLLFFLEDTSIVTWYYQSINLFVLNI